MSKTLDTKDVFGVYEQNIISSFATINREVPKYYQSITDLQHQCIQTCENTMKSVLSVQKEIVNKAGINANIPDAALSTIRDTSDGINKVYSVQNQIVQTALDATKQNIQTFNDNAKAFADLNKNIIHSWINVFTPRNN
ncbi:hypothetical protein LBMAG54_10830 [Nitrosopumilaceae archaeon]|nr:hypothetical protein EMGBD3_15880 [Nitrosarchaeum sp.]GDY16227.1 hypothetical protein LBMAG54_10830 [Nitrosopumilaceae archaeon]